MNKLRLIINTLILVTALCTVSSVACGQKKSAEVQRLERKRQAIQDEIKRVNSLLTKTANTTKGELKKLGLLQGQIRARQEVLATLNSEIRSTDQQVVKLELEIAELLEKFGKRQEGYVKSLRAMQNKHSGEDQILFILSAADFQQGLRRARYLQEYASWQKNEANKLKAMRLEIEEQRKALLEVREHKNALLMTQQAEQKKLKQDESNVQTQINRLKGQEKELKQELAKQRKQDAALNRQIEAQIAKEIREAEEARRRAEEAARHTGKKTETRKATTKGGYAMTEEELKLSGSFEQNQGRLPAPITGQYSIVGHFGEQQVAGLQYVRVNSSGIDLQGTSGAEARAVFDGVVTRVFTLEGYNNSVIVRHGNYLTVYSNLTSVYVKSGTKVNAGQSIGKVYADPELGGATKLHFQVWKETTKLNPLNWIRR